MSSHYPKTGPSHIREASGPGTVVAPHEQAVIAGMKMYEAGGNAVDAAVAAALVEAVIDPSATTLGGSGFCMIGIPDANPISVEFGPRASINARSDMYELDRDRAVEGVSSVGATVGDTNVSGPLAIGVPRTLLGLMTAQEKYGTLTRRQVCEPAIRAAADGFPADDWTVRMGLFQRSRLIADPYLRATFLDDEDLPLGSKSGSFQGSTVDKPILVKQPRLAHTLEQLADASSLEILTQGRIAQAMLTSLAERGAILTSDDLANSAPEIAAPLHRRFNGMDVYVPNGPTGAATVMQTLLIWDAMHQEDAKWYESGQTLRLMASAAKHAFADRYHWLGDSSAVNVPFDAMLSPDYAHQVAKQVLDGDFPRTSREPWLDYESNPLHNPAEATGSRQAPWSPTASHSSNAGTTNVSASDITGLVVTVTHTNAQPFGAAVACPRTGILFDAGMAWFNPAPHSANSINPGAKPLCNMSPALLFGKNLRVALGASGGRRIIGAVTEILTSLIYNSGETPETVLNRPRFDASGRRLILNRQLQPLLEEGEANALDVEFALATNELFSHDFARANLASVQGDRLTSAIDPNAYSH